jgi:hypothetical protein
MPEKRASRGVRFTIAVCVGVLLGVGMGLAMKAFLGQLNEEITPDGQKPAAVATGEGPADGAAEEGDAVSETPPEAPVDDAGMRYARNVQEGDWESVMAQTVWMQERLDYAASTGGGDEARTAAIDALAEELSNRSPVEAQLLPEGVEDKYVFAPGAELAWAGQDEGQQELARPTARRTWIRVTYPVKGRALRDEANIPIKAITVGVNLTADGEVLKANIVGNLDILRESISYAWRTTTP